jgi:hypothetical protein
MWVHRKSCLRHIKFLENNYILFKSYTAKPIQHAGAGVVASDLFPQQPVVGSTVCHTTRYRVSCAHNSSLKKITHKLYFQQFVHTSSTHKLCASSNLYLKIIWQKFVDRSMRISPKNENIRFIFEKSYVYKLFFQKKIYIQVICISSAHTD